MWKCERCNKECLSSSIPGRLQLWNDSAEAGSYLSDTDTLICEECKVAFCNFLRAPTESDT